MKDVPVPSIIAIVFGLLILLMPNILSYLIGIYLIVTGILALKKTK